MNERKRIFILMLIMAAACLAVAGTAIAMLYHTAFEEEREVLVATARSQARLIEAIVGFDKDLERDFPQISYEAALNRIIAAHRHYQGIGDTGEFTLAKREGDNIVFLFSHRHYDFDTPKPVAMESKLAEPMRRALSGNSGTIIGLDYRGVMVLAAYEPVAGPNWGIVAKIDLAELRSPFLKAGTATVFIAIVLISLGAYLFVRITNPIMQRLKEHSERLTRLVESLRRSEDELQTAKIDLENRVRERTEDLVLANKECRILSQKVLEAQEKERRRLSREIHDGIGQALVAIKLLTESYSVLTDDQARACKIEYTLQLIQDTIEEVRKIQNDLSPSYLDDLGILETLADLCERFQSTFSDIMIDMQSNISENDVPEPIKAPIFRISQEAMNNAAKHSGANQIRVCIKKIENQIKLTITDNGMGFDAEGAPLGAARKGGLGLYSMKERAEYSGGFLEIESAHRMGTTISASWPIRVETPE